MLEKHLNSQMWKWVEVKEILFFLVAIEVRGTFVERDSSLRTVIVCSDWKLMVLKFFATINYQFNKTFQKH